MHYLFILQELEIVELYIPKLTTAYCAQVEINNLLLPTQHTALFCTNAGEWIARNLQQSSGLKYALRYFTVFCSSSQILLSVANTFAIEFAKNKKNFWFSRDNLFLLSFSVSKRSLIRQTTEGNQRSPKKVCPV